ncbi:MAG: ATP-binding cassette domain-containing protein [Candidatus Hodarchaeota archaeon]
MPDHTIEVEGISKTFVKVTKKKWGFRPIERETTHALKSVSLVVNEGEILGLLGPNGAGKTTLVKVLSTIVLPDAGSAKIMGYDVVRQATEARRSFGATIGGGERSVYWKLTGIENLIFFGRLYGLSKTKANARAIELLELMALSEKKNIRVEDWSTGMKMKLNVARALVADPPVLLLDEPTLGLDPKFARDLRNFIKYKLQKEDQKSILLTTHYMAEADELCDRIALINRGDIVRIAPPSSLKQEIADEEVILVKVKGNVTSTILADYGVEKVVITAANGTTNLRIPTPTKESADTLYSVLGALREKKLVPLNVEVKQPTLEDAFIKLTGARLDEADTSPN